MPPGGCFHRLMVLTERVEQLFEKSEDMAPSPTTLRQRGFAKSLKVDGEEGLSEKRVDAIRRRLPGEDRRLIDLYLE